MSVDRAWFETLGGFTEDYVFGHYEDADLCLKSIQAGVVPWIHDIRLWHLEGQGSVHLPVHAGGALVNRWLFTKTWSDLVSDGLHGPNPTNPIMRDPQAVPRSGVPAQAATRAAAAAAGSTPASSVRKGMPRRSLPGRAFAAKKGAA